MFPRLRLAFLLSCLASPAIAATEVVVGDGATVRLEIEQEGQTYTGTMTSEVIGIKPGEAKPYLVRRNVAMNGQDKLEDVWLDGEDVGAESEISGFLSQCASKDGVLENVAVPAGTFAACTIPVKNDGAEKLGTLSIGRVPFGVVRLEMKVNHTGHLRIELLSFRKN